jgi:hypothetical protein
VELAWGLALTGGQCPNRGPAAARICFGQGRARAADARAPTGSKRGREERGLGGAWAGLEEKGLG